MLYSTNCQPFDWNDFSRIFKHLDRAFEGTSHGADSKQLDFRETKDGLLASLDLPGVSPEQLDVQVQGNILDIHVKAEEASSEGRFLSREWSVPKFQYRLQIPNSLNTKKIDARLKDGVLTILIPKAEEAKPRVINVIAA